ncbi:MAG: 2-oxoacid:acceptor oxidoreductase family protein, partial [Phycisphaerales bacterium]
MAKKLSLQKKDDLSIVLCGQAGMGVQSVEFLLTRILKLAGYNVFATKEYMSRIRGGTNSTEIRVSSEPVHAVVDRIDILVPFDKGAVEHLRKRISTQTVILADKATIGDDINPDKCTFIEMPFAETALEIGDKIYANIVATAAIVSLFGIELQMVTNYVEKFFAGKSQDVIQKNIEAAKTGYKLGSDLVSSGKIKCQISKDDHVKDQVLLSGTEAVALGTIAGGCNFISSYPMTPATGVLVFLAQHSKEFGIIAEQAEDEISAINMALGA